MIRTHASFENPSVPRLLGKLRGVWRHVTMEGMGWDLGQAGNTTLELGRPLVGWSMVQALVPQEEHQGLMGAGTHPKPWPQCSLCPPRRQYGLFPQVPNPFSGPGDQSQQSGGEDDFAAGAESSSACVPRAEGTGLWEAAACLPAPQGWYLSSLPSPLIASWESQEP